MIARVGPSDANVLITGENATGKSQAAILEIMGAGESNNGTYLYGEEIVKEGFATKMIESGKGEDKD